MSSADKITLDDLKTNAARDTTVIHKAGDTMSGELKAYGGISLNNSTPKVGTADYFLTTDFDNTGRINYINKSDLRNTLGIPVSLSLDSSNQATIVASQNGAETARLTINNVDTASNTNRIIDTYNNNKISVSYGNAGIPWNEFTWLAGWNGYELRAMYKPTISDLGGIPQTRKINGKSLSSDITLTASDISGIPSEKSLLTFVFRVGPYGYTPKLIFKTSFIISRTPAQYSLYDSRCVLDILNDLALYSKRDNMRAISSSCDLIDDTSFNITSSPNYESLMNSLRHFYSFTATWSNGIQTCKYVGISKYGSLQFSTVTFSYDKVLVEVSDI